ncbi:hypothetical protein BH09PSE3_BH09PSE3_08630 [soil metagenome]
MTRFQVIVLFVSVFLIALIALCPLGAGIAVSGLGASGLSARAATGTIWSGSLSDAYFGPVPLGDVDVALYPLPLLTGRAELGVSGISGTGRVTGGAGSFGVGEVAAKLSLAKVFAPLPLDILALNDVTVRFDDGRCKAAEGRVHASFTGDIAGLDLQSGLSGDARCDANDLMLPLVSPSGTQRLGLHIAGDGRWNAVLTVQATDPAMIEKLGGAGFRPVAGGYVLRLSGRV